MQFHWFVRWNNNPRILLIDIEHAGNYLVGTCSVRKGHFVCGSIEVSYVLFLLCFLCARSQSMYGHCASAGATWSRSNTQKWLT